MPIWPHERFAASCAIDEWDDAMPSPINLSDWIEKWTPGMLSDGRQVAVFPTREDRGMVVDPIKLSDDLKEELMNLIGCHTPKLASLPVLRPNSV